MKKKKYVSNKIPLWVQSKMRNLKAIKGEGKGSVFFFLLVLKIQGRLNLGTWGSAVDL